MYKTKLGLGLSASFGLSDADQIRLFRKTGFEAFFSDWKQGADIGAYRAIADETGIEYQSIHAPFDKAALMWKPRPEAQAAIDELIACLQDCSNYHVSIMIAHTFIGFKDHMPTKYGVENYGVVVDAAKQLGVQIALENTEGEEYLDCLMEAFQDCSHVGFCLDTGHEMCYNYSRDMLEKYGDRLIATHINDNLGISREDGEIFWTDDLHLLPFDGVGDWEDIARRLNRHRYEGILTFELTRASKPDRHDNDKYMKWTPEEYIAEAYARACRVAALKQRMKE